MRKEFRNTPKTRLVNLFVGVFAAFAIAALIMAFLYPLAEALDTQESVRESAIVTVVALAVSVLCIVSGHFLKKQTTHRERITMPVPSLSQWEEAMKSDTRKDDGEALRAQVARELLSQMPPLNGKKARTKYWADRCYEHLAGSDFPRAWAAARHCLDVNEKCLEALLTDGIAASYFARQPYFDQSLQTAVAQYGLTPSVSWAIGWALTAFDDWRAAEPYLLEAVVRRPQEPTLWALIAVSQWSQGKTSEALRNVRRALELAPHELRSQVLHARVLIDAGRPKDALRELDSVLPLARPTFTRC